MIFIKELQRQADEAALKIVGQAERIKITEEDHTDINKQLFIYQDEIIPDILTRIRALEKPKEETSGKPHQTVIFQRNIYNPKP